MANFTPEQIEQFLEEFFDVVGRRQYIGARYVPIFGRKDESSIAWDNTKPYEPLTIVLYQGNSYTSRTYVPAGIAITDTTYWANTGNYNAQVEQYRNEVQTFDGRITQNAQDISQETQNRQDADTALGQRIDGETQNRQDADTALGQRIDGETQNRQNADTALGQRIDGETQNRQNADTALGQRIDNEILNRQNADTTLENELRSEIRHSVRNVGIFIGNSYTDGVGGNPNDGMFNGLKYLFNNAYTFTSGGAGFGTYQDHDITYYDLLQNAAASTSFDNSDVTDIIFTSAMGDTRALCAGNENEVLTNIKNAYDYIKLNFPNATMHICFAEMVYGRTTQSQYSQFYYMAQLRLDYLFRTRSRWIGLNYMGWIGWYGNGQTGFNASDNYHPSHDGYCFLYGMFLNAWYGESPYCLVKSLPVTYNDLRIGTFVADRPNHCTFTFEGVPRSLFPAAMAEGITYDLTSIPIVTPSVLPSFVPFIGANMPMTGTLRLGAGIHSIFTMRINGVIDETPTRTTDMYLKMLIYESFTNPQSGNFYGCGSIDTWYHPNADLVSMVLE